MALQLWPFHFQVDLQLENHILGHQLEWQLYLDSKPYQAMSLQGWAAIKKPNAFVQTGFLRFLGNLPPVTSNEAQGDQACRRLLGRHQALSSRWASSKLLRVRIELVLCLASKNIAFVNFSNANKQHTNTKHCFKHQQHILMCAHT